MLSIALAFVLGGIITQCSATINSHCCLSDQFEAHLDKVFNAGFSWPSNTEILNIGFKELDVYYDSTYKQIAFIHTYDIVTKDFSIKHDIRSFRIIQDFNKLMQYTINIHNQTCTKSPLTDNFHRVCTEKTMLGKGATPMNTVSYTAKTKDFKISMSMSIENNILIRSCNVGKESKFPEAGYKDTNRTMVTIKSSYKTNVFSEIEQEAFGYATPRITDPAIFNLPNFCT
ncbi:hypothetical protein SNE40_011997 [Patella caerulea]|uniref:LolA-like domain-containing protein n=1 Tax=Patella caerulea TaxID=87958 RepID=A0AAN8JMM2_PATCE